MSEFDDFLVYLDDSPFEEIPVDIDTFVQDEHYLGKRKMKLSPIQRDCVLNMTQIYRKETLASFMTSEEAERRWAQTKNEIILMLGKGCHAPYTPVFNAKTGRWHRLDQFLDVNNKVIGYTDGELVEEYATESFMEGHGRMLRVTTGYGWQEDVYEGHKYYAWKNVDFLQRNLRLKPEGPSWMEVKDLDETYSIALGMGFDISEPKDLSVDVARRLGIDAHNKFVPDVVWRCSNKIIGEFLSAFLSSHAKLTRRLRSITVEYMTDSEQLANDLHRMYLRLGVPARFKKVKDKFDISVVGTRNCGKLRKVVSLKDWQNEAIDREFSSLADKKTSVVENYYAEGLFWDRISKIEDIGTGDYWSLTQPNSSNYVGNGPISQQSGKDELSAMAIAYIVYQLLCLKDPAAYYGKPTNDNIDILNVAVNSEQANRVFFKKFKNYITVSPWFEGKYTANLNGEPARQGAVDFIKNVNVYSGHSERESWEGYNLFAVVLDEIAAFALESAKGETGKTAEAIYKMYRASVNSRFAEFGKYISLSFPRYKGDFIMQLYDKVVASKQTVERSETMKIDSELPDGIPGNEIVIEWDEDHIDAYTAPRIYALRRPSWDVNPTVTLDEKVSEFVSDYADALGRFACMPPDSVDAFFRDKSRIEDTFSYPNGWDHEEGRYRWDFEPKPDTEYFIHVDLAQKHDRCAVALAHVDKWVRREIAGKVYEPAPEIVVDALRYWIPTKQKEVDFSEVQDYIVDLQRKGFNLRLVTFDRWRCVLGNAILSTPQGPVTMAEINSGDTVMTRYGPAIVGNKFDTGVQEAFRIRTRLGYEFEATANHKMFTRDGWKTVGELTDEDELLLNNRSFDDPEDTISEDQAYALGALIADGWINDKKNYLICLTTPDIDFLEEFDRCIKEGWGFKNKCSRYLKPGTNCFDAKYCDKEMIERMRAAGLGYELSHTKTVPHSVLNGSRKVKAAFIAGYFDGDGGVQHYTDRKGHSRVRASMDTVSEALAKQLAWMFLSLGLEPSRIRQDRDHHKAHSTIHRFTFEGRKAERFFEQICPVVTRKAGLINTRSKETKERWVFQDNELWVKVQSIESIGEHQTYDINVPEYNEFIADGFVTHNSEDMRKYLNSVGIRTELLSVKKEQFVDMAVIMNESRLRGPDEHLLREELLGLRLFNSGKIDHPRSGYKDLSDATVGAVFNALTKTPRNRNVEIEAKTKTDYIREERNEQGRNVIRAPRTERVPDDIQAYLDSIQMI